MPGQNRIPEIRRSETGLSLPANQNLFIRALGFYATGVDDGSWSVVESVRNAFIVVCGDGIVVSVEQCDDGNTLNGDGCSATCTVEAGYTCAGTQPSVRAQCPAGTYQNGLVCTPCTSGSYQNQTGQTSCTTCTAACSTMQLAVHGAETTATSCRPARRGARRGA